MLKIDLLGNLKVVRDGTALQLPQSKKTRAPLAYLVLTGRPHSRERLVSLFWDVPDDPRGALRWSLTKLRGLVDEQEVKRLKADRDTVAFDPVDVEVDLLTLRRLLADEGAGTPTETLVALAESLQGADLTGLDLPDCPEYHTWYLAQQEDAHELMARLHRVLIGRFEDEPARALQHARALSALRPYDVDARASLVRLLSRSGRRQEAEARRDEALRVLEDAGEDPAALRALFQSALDGTGQGAETGTAAAPVAAAPSGGAAPARSAETKAILSRPAVAVLPFDNISGDPEQDYLAIGITDDLITALSCWRWFPVIARTTIFAYQGKQKDVTTIGKELGAQYIVQGSLRRSGDRVRVVAQLVDGERGTSIWAQRYDRAFENIFDLQQEIADQIAVHIEPELHRYEHWRVAKQPVQDLRSWHLNIRAVTLMLRGEPEDLKAAMELLDQSLKRGPNSSYTYSLRALCMYFQALLVWKDEDPAEPARSYLATARKAVELDEANWLGHALLGITLLWGRRDYAQAAEEVLRALELNPTAALAHQFMGCVRNFDGNPDQAIPHLEAALRLNPTPASATLQLSDLSLAYLLQGDFERAEDYARQAISKLEANTRAWERLAASLGHQNRRDEARAALEQLTRQQGPLREGYLEMTYPFRTGAHRELLWGGLQRAGWAG